MHFISMPKMCLEKAGNVWEMAVLWMTVSILWLLILDEGLAQWWTSAPSPTPLIGSASPSPIFSRPFTRFSDLWKKPWLKNSCDQTKCGDCLYHQWCSACTHTT